MRGRLRQYQIRQKSWKRDYIGSERYYFLVSPHFSSLTSRKRQSWCFIGVMMNPTDLSGWRYHTCLQPNINNTGKHPFAHINSIPSQIASEIMDVVKSATMSFWTGLTSGYLQINYPMLKYTFSDYRPHLHDGLYLRYGHYRGQWSTRAHLACIPRASQFSPPFTTRIFMVYFTMDLMLDSRILATRHAPWTRIIKQYSVLPLNRSNYCLMYSFQAVHVLEISDPGTLPVSTSHFKWKQSSLGVQEGNQSNTYQAV